MTTQDLISIAGKHASNILKKGYLRQDWALPADEWSKTFVGAFIKKYPTRPQVLTLICNALGKPSVSWGDLTKVNLNKVSTYICGKVSPNSASVYLHLIKALLHDFSEEGCVPCKSLSTTLKAKSVPSQHVALTQEELDRFEAYEPRSAAERDIKALFMRACYTGARCSDAKAMTGGNVVKGVGGDVLTYISKKTKVEVALPMHHNLQKYLSQEITRDYAAKVTSQVVRRICKAIGMTERISLYVGGKQKCGEKWEFITMHSARRTFCTLLAQKGVNVETIRAMAGHTSSKMTDRYICLDGRNPGKDAMAFFNGAVKTA